MGAVVLNVQMVKIAGGTLIPVDDESAEQMSRFKTGDVINVKVKLLRNPTFHRKVFAFFNFCFEYWTADKTDWQFLDKTVQFDTFRKHLTVLAGYRVETYTIDGRVRVEAMSLSYENMTQEEFERCYHALINAALHYLFNKTTDQNVIERLYSFF
ncbi:DUF1367 family protein [Seminibacterium arietis]|uniref:DUF1367 family protein n=1 Tax=Seminibacterium arietis TaxID=1173502 RepID=UPI0036D37937